MSTRDDYPSQHPILFSGPMVRAIMEGRKTQTRREVKWSRKTPFEYLGGCREDAEWNDPSMWGYETTAGEMMVLAAMGDGDYQIPCPYGDVGDRLWVRESWRYYDWTEDGDPYIQYRADDAVNICNPTADWSQRVMDIWADLSAQNNFARHAAARDTSWRPSTHMPRWASRINLVITDVRVERLQSIDYDDIVAEGWDVTRSRPITDGRAGDDARAWWRSQWECTGWYAANPWVWALTFRSVASS